MVDELDRKIISILQKDARLSYREIAKRSWALLLVQFITDLKSWRRKR